MAYIKCYTIQLTISQGERDWLPLNGFLFCIYYLQLIHSVKLGN
jgi:hypothetical protein